MSEIKTAVDTTNDFTSLLEQRITKLEDNILTIQKAINNLQFHYGTQAAQTELIKTKNAKTSFVI
jgi:hypothetical protein